MLRLRSPVAQGYTLTYVGYFLGVLTAILSGYAVYAFTMRHEYGTLDPHQAWAGLGTAIIGGIVALIVVLVATSIFIYLLLQPHNQRLALKTTAWSSGLTIALFGSTYLLGYFLDQTIFAVAVLSIPGIAFSMAMTSEK